MKNAGVRNWATMMVIGGMVLSGAAHCAAPATYEQCAAMPDANNRLACFDTLGKKASKKKSNLTAAEQEKASAAKSAAEKEKASAAQAEAAKVADLKREAQKAEEAAKEALKGLRKLKIRVETGVSYRDYPSALTDAKLEVTQFTESAYAKTLPRVADAMTAAIGHYNAVVPLWDWKISRGAEGYARCNKDFSTTKGFVQDLAKNYENIHVLMDGQTGCVVVDEAIPIIWAEADKETAKAIGLLNDLTH